jgi:asparagine synthase (glutamine-hydrolysing)
LSSEADQPITTIDGQVTIVLNGAIFNFIAVRDELRALGAEFRTQSDTEVIAVGYAVWGESVFERLDGMFSVCLYDHARARVILARDRLGIKPLHVTRVGQSLLFSSEIKPFFAFPGFERRINKDAVAEQLAFQFLKPPRTLFDGVDVFMPGHVMTIDVAGGEISSKPYWRIDADLIDREPCESLASVLEQSIKRCWNSDRQAGLQLSGGVDSSLISMISKDRLAMGTYPTFSVLFDDSNGRYYEPRSEERFIQRVADECGLPNKSWVFSDEEVRRALPEALWRNEQPLYGPSTALYLLLGRAIGDDATVLLTGEGADDIFLGYFPKWTFDHSVDDLMKLFIQRPMLEKLLGADGVERAVAGRHDLINQERFSGFSARQTASAVTIETVLHGLLARHDRMFMASSIEGRPPFCSNRMVEARFAMPDDAVHDGMNGKVALKNMLAEYTDHDFAFRKKIGFSSPFGDWCASPKIWNGYVQSIDEERMADFINVDALREHAVMPEGRDKWSGQNLNMIFSITQMQLWMNIFFDGDATQDGTWLRHVQ